MRARVLEAEWLDTMRAEDPRARRSRADLRRVNALMGNARIVASALRSVVPEGPRSLVELGAGDGAFALKVLHALDARGTDVTLVDRQRIVAGDTLAAFGAMGSKVAVAKHDAFDWLRRSQTRVDVVIANLFLHHFEQEPLARLLALIAERARVFVACETRRSAVALAGAHMLGVVGCNDVTRHDAVVSVAAGFRDGEISALWPQGARWSIDESARGLFSHLFVARRLDS